MAALAMGGLAWLVKIEYPGAEQTLSELELIAGWCLLGAVLAAFEPGE